jgi:FAD/FMN-containing dehydrogenase
MYQDLMRSTHDAEQRSAPRAIPGTIPELRAALRGEVIAPDDLKYESARLVVNAAVDRRPALIVRPADAADVALAVLLGRSEGLELAVRGGGHSFAGHGTTEGGLILDMSDMRALHVDPQRRIAWAQAGLTAEQYTAQTARHALATGFGDTGSVGIAGLTLGGGIGWLVRKHGLTIDDLLAVELVTAGGERLHVDSERHPDLFWALRGGGGNFGIVTRLQYQLHELDTILGGMLVLPASPGILGSFIAAADDAPDELSTIAVLARLPPLPFVSAEHHGQLALMVRLVYAGDLEHGQQALAPLRALATPLADAITPMPYQQLYPAEGPSPGRLRRATRSMFIDHFTDHAESTVFDRVQSGPSVMSAVEIRVLGGAMARVPADATAFSHRRRRLMVTFGAGYQDQDQAASHDTWVADSLTAMRPAVRGVHVSFLGDEGAARVHEAYPADTYERLAAIKRRYDPTNLFHVNQNIPPRAGTMDEQHTRHQRGSTHALADRGYPPHEERR